VVSLHAARGLGNIEGVPLKKKLQRRNSRGLKEKGNRQGKKRLLPRASSRERLKKREEETIEGRKVLP